MFQNENWFEPIFFDEHQLSSCVSFSDCECVCICIFMYVCIYHLLSLLFSLSLSLCHCSYSSRHQMTTALCAENFISLNAFNANNCHCFANLFHTNAPDFFFSYSCFVLYFTIFITFLQQIPLFIMNTVHWLCFFFCFFFVFYSQTVFYTFYFHTCFILFCAHVAAGCSAPL